MPSLGDFGRLEQDINPLIPLIKVLRPKIIDSSCGQGGDQDVWPIPRTPQEFRVWVQDVCKRFPEL